jgi:hypothetical protein
MESVWSTELGLEYIEPSQPLAQVRAEAMMHAERPQDAIEMIYLEFVLDEGLELRKGYRPNFRSVEFPAPARESVEA